MHVKILFLFTLRFHGFLIALIHALADSGHDSRGKIKGRIQHFFWDSYFPGVRQALIDSRLAVTNDGNGDADQFFLSFCQQVRSVSIVIVFTKVCLFTHRVPPLKSR
jgi:hypothetical protein